MGIFDRFPYSSTHEMNLDFMLGKATEIAESLQEVQDGLSDIDTHKAQAEQAATNAAQSAQSAAQAAQAAAGSQTTAGTSASQAAQHKADAEDAADRAEAASNLADEAVEQAQTAAQNASTAATNASTAATNASTAADGAIASAAAAETRINNLAASLPKDFTELNNEVNELDARITHETVSQIYTKNLYDPSRNENKTIDSVAVGGTQTVSDSTTLVAQKIWIPYGENLTFTGVRSYSLVDDNNIVTYQKTFIETTATVQIVWSNLPTGTTFVWLCTYKENATTNTQLEIGNTSTAYTPYVFGLQINGKDIPLDFLNGKKYVAAGDSYTAWSDAEYISGEYKGQPVTYDREIRLSHIMTGLNAGISGSTMALCKSSITDKASRDLNAFSNTRYLNIPSDTDILTISFGINDVTYCDVGQLGDTTNKTFYGAWDTVLKYYRQYRPSMKIGILLFQREDNAFYRAVIEIAKYYGIPVLDFYGGEDTPIYVDGKAYPVSSEISELRREYYGGHAHASADTETFQGKTVRYIVDASAHAGHPGFRTHIDESNIIAQFLKRL